MNEHEPVLERYRAEDHPEFATWVSLPTPDVITRMKTLRAQLSRNFESLPLSSLARVGIYPVYEPLRLADWLEFFLAHEGHHVYLALLRVGQARRVREP